MNRRQFLITGSAGMAVGLAGCLSDGDGRPEIEGSGVTVSPGEKAVLEIEASNVGSIRFSGLPEPDGLSLEISDTDLSPSPSGQDDAFPPYWNWSGTRSTVDVETQLHAAESVAPGEYRYEITVWNRPHYEDDADATTDEYPITIEAV